MFSVSPLSLCLLTKVFHLSECENTLNGVRKSGLIANVTYYVLDQLTYVHLRSGAAQIRS
jgi:hypothetical protein